MGFLPKPIVLPSGTSALDVSGFKRAGPIGGKSVYYTSPVNGNTYGNFAWMADILTATPLVIPKEVTLDQIGIRVATPGTATLSRLGIYADDGNVYPGALLLDAGTVDVSTAGFKALDISLSLSPGLYWLATLHNGGVTLKVSTPANQVNVMGHDPVVASQAFSRIDAAMPFGSLPDPFPGNGNYIVGGFRLVFVRVAA
ncbi:MAG: hypothetical protein L6R28_03955 [Planctomycetes bacterium]|nr:hypothetical protein [Planctomycetota bacterium]